MTALAVFPEGSGGLTKLGLIAIAIITTAVVHRLLPSGLRPVGRVVPALAAVAAFAAVRIGADSGFSEWLDHDVFERIGGETDDFPTWLVAAAAVAAVFVVARLVRRRR